MYLDNKTPQRCINEVTEYVSKKIKETELLLKKNENIEKTILKIVKNDTQLEDNIKNEQPFIDNLELFKELHLGLSLANCAKDEFKNVLKNNIVRNYSLTYANYIKNNRSLIEALDRQIKYLNQLKNKGPSTNEKVIIDMVLVNSGRMDSLIHPTGTLCVGEYCVEIVNVSDFKSLIELEKLENERNKSYFILRQGEFSRVKFFVSKKYSVRNDFVELLRLLKARQSVDFTIEIKTDQGKEQLTKTMTADIISFEQEFEQEF